MASRNWISAGTLAEAEGNALARWLTLLPANHLTPTEYRGYVKVLAQREGWKFEFLDEKKLKTLGAGAFLAVSKGSDPRCRDLHLTYKPAKDSTDNNPSGAGGQGHLLRHRRREPEIRQVHVRHAR